MDPAGATCVRIYGVGDCSESNFCSGVGNCTAGRCACPPGYLDANCSRYLTCSYWDANLQAWSSEGVATSLSEDGSSVSCATSHLTDFGGLVSFPSSSAELAAEVKRAFTFNTFSIDEAFSLLSSFSTAANPTITLIVCVLGGLNVFTMGCLGMYRGRRAVKRRRAENKMYRDEARAAMLAKLQAALAKIERAHTEKEKAHLARLLDAAREDAKEKERQRRATLAAMRAANLTTGAEGSKGWRKFGRVSDAGMAGLVGRMRAADGSAERSERSSGRRRSALRSRVSSLVFMRSPNKTAPQPPTMVEPFATPEHNRTLTGRIPMRRPATPPSDDGEEAADGPEASASTAARHAAAEVKQHGRNRNSHGQSSRVDRREALDAAKRQRRELLFAQGKMSKSGHFGRYSASGNFHVVESKVSKKSQEYKESLTEFCGRLGRYARSDHTVINLLKPPDNEEALTQPQMVQLFWMTLAVELFVICFQHNGVIASGITIFVVFFCAHIFRLGNSRQRKRADRGWGPKSRQLWAYLRHRCCRGRPAKPPVFEEAPDTDDELDDERTRIHDKYSFSGKLGKRKGKGTGRAPRAGDASASRSAAGGKGGAAEGAAANATPARKVQLPPSPGAAGCSTAAAETRQAASPDDAAGALAASSLSSACAGAAPVPGVLVPSAPSDAELSRTPSHALVTTTTTVTTTTVTTTQPIVAGASLGASPPPSPGGASAAGDGAGAIGDILAQTERSAPLVRVARDEESGGMVEASVSGASAAEASVSESSGRRKKRTLGVGGKVSMVRAAELLNAGSGCGKGMQSEEANLDDEERRQRRKMRELQANLRGLKRAGRLRSVMGGMREKKTGEAADAFAAAALSAQLKYKQEILRWRGPVEYKLRQTLAWTFNLSVVVMAYLVSIVYASKFGEKETYRMIIGWLMAYGWTFFIIEPLQILILAGAPCIFSDRHACGRCMNRLRFCYNELLAP